MGVCLCTGRHTCKKLMRGQKALWMGWDEWGRPNFLFRYMLPSGRILLVGKGVSDTLL